MHALLQRYRDVLDLNHSWNVRFIFLILSLHILKYTTYWNCQHYYYKCLIIDILSLVLLFAKIKQSKFCFYSVSYLIVGRVCYCVILVFSFWRFNELALLYRVCNIINEGEIFIGILCIFVWKTKPALLKIYNTIISPFTLTCLTVSCNELLFSYFSMFL